MCDKLLKTISFSFDMLHHHINIVWVKEHYFSGSIQKLLWWTSESILQQMGFHLRSSFLLPSTFGRQKLSIGWRLVLCSNPTLSKPLPKTSFSNKVVPNFTKLPISWISMKYLIFFSESYHRADSLPLAHDSAEVSIVCLLLLVARTIAVYDQLKV